MQRYFVENTLQDRLIKISGDDFHHIKNVMRMNFGDKIYVANGKSAFFAVIKEINADHIIVELLEEIKENKELKVNVTIAQGMPKFDKFEMVIQKTTELGVTEIIPVLSERSLIKIDTKIERKKLDRYKKIAKEAAEQSHRFKIPKIIAFMSLKEFIKYSESYDYKLVAYEASSDSDETNFKRFIKTIKENEKMVIFIGPEGGISEKELLLLTENDFKVISLGNRILRTETAPLFIMSAITYELELKG